METDCLFIILGITTAINIAATATATVAIKCYFVTNNSINSYYSVISHTQQATYKLVPALRSSHCTRTVTLIGWRSPHLISINTVQMYTKDVQFIYQGLLIRVNKNILICVIQTS